MTDTQTTYDTMEVITLTIFEMSAVCDVDAIVRTGEIAAVLITALACTLATSYANQTTPANTRNSNHEPRVRRTRATTP